MPGQDKFDSLVSDIREILKKINPNNKADDLVCGEIDKLIQAAATELKELQDKTPANAAPDELELLAFKDKSLLEFTRTNALLKTADPKQMYSSNAGVDLGLNVVGLLIGGNVVGSSGLENRMTEVQLRRDEFTNQLNATIEGLKPSQQSLRQLKDLIESIPINAKVSRENQDKLDSGYLKVWQQLFSELKCEGSAPDNVQDAIRAVDKKLEKSEKSISDKYKDTTGGLKSLGPTLEMLKNTKTPTAVQNFAAGMKGAITAVPVSLPSMIILGIFFSLAANPFTAGLIGGVLAIVAVRALYKMRQGYKSGKTDFNPLHYNLIRNKLWRKLGGIKPKILSNKELLAHKADVAAKSKGKPSQISKSIIDRSGVLSAANKNKIFATEPGSLLEQTTIKKFSNDGHIDSPKTTPVQVITPLKILFTSEPDTSAPIAKVKNAIESSAKSQQLTLASTDDGKTFDLSDSKAEGSKSTISIDMQTRQASMKLGAKTKQQSDMEKHLGVYVDALLAAGSPTVNEQITLTQGKDPIQTIDFAKALINVLNQKQPGVDLLSCINLDKLSEDLKTEVKGHITTLAKTNHSSLRI